MHNSKDVKGDLVAVATEAGSFGTLLAAATAAGLVETLQSAGPFTVFAPTDEAFASLPEGLVKALLMPENKDALVKILTYHVLASAVHAADVKSGDVETVEGSKLSIEVGDKVVLNGSVHVTATDVQATNGIIHVIDAVLVPKDVNVGDLI
jgi:uncharacterized surface protein with fasciclin (FAS1) repeats